MDRLTHEDVVALVERAVPDLAVRRLTILRQLPAWIAAEVNGDYVFHFAGDAAAADSLAAEHRLLEAISGRISTRLPDPWRSAPDHRFTAYRWIDGHPIGGRAFDGSLSDTALTRAAADVGRFLAELHQAVDLETAVGLRLPPPVYPTSEPHLLGRTLPLMEGEEDRALVRRVHSLLSEVTPRLRSPTLIHGDLHGDNLIIADDGSLVGVFDFRTAAVADRHVDFRCLLGYGDMMEGAVESYNLRSKVSVDLRSCQVISAANDLYDMTWRAEKGTPHSLLGALPVRVAGLREQLRGRGLL